MEVFDAKELASKQSFFKAIPQDLPTYEECEEVDKDRGHDGLLRARDALLGPLAAPGRGHIAPCLRLAGILRCAQAGLCACNTLLMLSSQGNKSSVTVEKWRICRQMKYQETSTNYFPAVLMRSVGLPVDQHHKAMIHHQNN